MLYDLTLTDRELLRTAAQECGGEEAFNVTCRALLDILSKEISKTLRLSNHILGKIGALEEHYDCHFVDAKCLPWLRTHGQAELYLESAEFVFDNRGYILWAKQQEGPVDAHPVARLLVAMTLCQNIHQSLLDYERGNFGD